MTRREMFARILLSASVVMFATGTAIGLVMWAVDLARTEWNW